MSHYRLFHETVAYKYGTIQSILDALKDLSDCDDDFNGENGIEYADEVAIEKGFESNQAYYLDKAKSTAISKGEKEAVDEFLHNWLDNDGCYAEWEYKTIKKGGFVFISLAAMTCC